MNNTKIVAGIVGLSLLILVGGVLLVSRTPQPPKIIASPEARIEVPETTHAWGRIPIDGGNVEKVFSIKNVGSGTLELANVQTSCMCTEAQVIVNGEKSPFFGMHASSSWMGRVEAGQEAQLVVIFDPAFHGPSGVGQITRIVSLQTNDREHQKLEFTLTAEVTNT